MQDELTTDGVTGVWILGVNQLGHESGNATMTSGRDLPWLQETTAQPVWTPWDVTYRDVIIVDGANRRIGTYNLTEHDLSVPGNYAELKAMLRAAAKAR